MSRPLPSRSARYALALAFLAASLGAACARDPLSPGRAPDVPPVDTAVVTPVPRVDSGPRVTLLLELQRVDGAALPVTVLDAGTPRVRVDAYAGGLQLFADGTWRVGVALSEERDGVAQPARAVRDSGTYRVGEGRITLHAAGGGAWAIELGPDSTWTVERSLVDGAAPARWQFGTEATRPPVLAMTGSWSCVVTGLTDGAVRCSLRGFGWTLAEKDGAVAGESIAESGPGTGMDCAVVGRVPPFVTPTYGAGMPVTGRIVGDRVVLESRMDDGAGGELLAWRAEGRVVASSTQMWSHVEGTLTVRETDGGAVRTYAGSFVMRRR